MGSSSITISRRTFFTILAAVTVVRLILTYWIPIKNDEAYYVFWAQHLDGGYYDHPPLIGWLIWVLSLVSDSIFWFRSISIVAGLVASWGVYRIAREYWGDENARFAAILFALSPSSMWMVFISNDAPLLILIVLSVVSFHKANTESRYIWSWISGLLLGLAFLTKYLAVIVGIGYLVFALLDDRQRRLRHLLLVLAGVIPFAIQHIYYNYYNCWNTVNFHLYVRNVDSQLSLGNLASYFVELVLVLTPWGLWYLYKNRNKLPEIRRSLLLTVSLTAVIVVGLVSFKSIIGLHFLLIFSPFVFVFFGSVDTPGAQKKMLVMSSIYGLVLAGVLVALLLYPLEKLKGWVHHSNFVVGLAPEKVCSSLEKYSDFPLFTNYYAQAGILSYTCNKNIQVMFGESNYGRQMDAPLDVRKLNGKRIAVLELGKLNPDNYKKYFTEYRVDNFEVYGAPFSVIVGKGFDYSRYRQELLARIKKMYYSPPGWMPIGGCPFNEKYFPAISGE